MLRRCRRVRCSPLVFVVTSLLLLLLWIVFGCQSKGNRCERVIADEPLGTYDIPNIVHFITGQGDASDAVLDRFGPRLGARRMERAPATFQLINYLVLLSARRHIRPRQLFVHYAQEPTGDWWLKAKQDRELNLTVRPMAPVTSIYHHALHHHAHRTDIARLEVLDRYGGIYLDLDVLVLKSFDALLSNAKQAEAIIAWESQQYQAICNAVILAPVHSRFLRRIHQSYQSFNASCWACHSVLLTGQLATIYSREVQILPSNAFFAPSWSRVEELYVYNQFDFRANYACHLWHSYVGEIFLRNLTLHSILRPTRMTTFVRMLVHAVGSRKLEAIGSP